MATAQVRFTTKPPDARRNGRTQYPASNAPLGQRCIMVGIVTVGALLVHGWQNVGSWLAECWFMVCGLMLGQRVSNEQSNVGPTKYDAVGPTLNQRLGFGWQMVDVLAGVRRHSLTIHWPNQVMLPGAPLLPYIGPVSVVSVCLTALRPAPMLLCTICPHGGTTNVVVYILSTLWRNRPWQP